MNSKAGLALIKKLLAEQDSEGFSLVELVVVIAVLSVLSAVAIPSFLCVTTKARATAALSAMKQIQKECIVKKSFEEQEIFQTSNLQGYQIQSDGGNSCKGAQGTGVVSAIPEDTNAYPTFNLAYNTGELSYSFRGQTGTDFKECLGLICDVMNSDKGGEAFKKELEANDFVLKDTYMERGCSAYAWVKGPTWQAAQANAKAIGGNLATINDAEENQWVVDKFNKKARDSIQSDSQGVKNLFIGLTRVDTKKDEGSNDGWISGEKSSFRPQYWGTGGMGTDSDGNYSSLEIRKGSDELKWNDFPSWQHDGVGLAEISLCK